MNTEEWGKKIIEGIKNTHASSKITKLFGSKVFGTTKPEKLIQFLINLGSFENDIVLDFFMMYKRLSFIKTQEFGATASMPLYYFVIVEWSATNAVLN